MGSRKPASLFTITPADHLSAAVRDNISNPLYDGEKWVTVGMVTGHHGLPHATNDKLTRATSSSFYQPPAPHRQTREDKSEHDYATIDEGGPPRLRLGDVFVVGCQVFLGAASLLLVVIPVLGLCSRSVRSAHLTRQSLYSVLLGPLVVNSLTTAYNFLWQRKQNLNNRRYILVAMFLHSLNAATSFIFAYKVVAEAHRVRQGVPTSPLFLLDLSLSMVFVLTTVTSGALIIRGGQLLVQGAVKRAVRRRGPEKWRV